MTNERYLELLTKFLTSEISTDEHAELKHLMDIDESLRDQFDYFKVFWRKNTLAYNNSERLFAGIKSRISEKSADPVLNVKNKNPRRYWYATAAVFLLMVMFFCGYIFLHRTHPQNSEMIVKGALPGKKTIITLADGTKVTLNSESSLKYPSTFTDSTRDVYLAGEAFFDVHKDHKHPFIVHTAKMNVRVLGTAFDVKSYNNDSASEASLIRGIIEVTLADRPSDRIILRPNEKLIVNQHFPETRAQGNLGTVPDNHVHRDTKYTITSLTYYEKKDSTIVETSWLSDRFVFKNEDFETLCNRLERWYGVTINIENDTLKNYRFTGSFKKESIEDVLNILSYTEPFHYKKNNGIILID